MDRYEDFDIVKNLLKNNFNVKEISDRNGIWFRRAEFEKDGNQFILYWDEELGIFFIRAPPKDEHKEAPWLEKLTMDIIPLIETHLNQHL